MNVSPCTHEHAGCGCSSLWSSRTLLRCRRVCTPSLQPAARNHVRARKLKMKHGLRGDGG
eukprot:2096537-Rhodomonas_salina.1